MRVVTRRQFLKAVLVSTAFASWRCSVPKRKPNIVLIMADDLGYGDLGCYGSEWIKTPNIDALAAEGLRFTDYHSNGAVCTPTRAALVTGRYQQRALLEGVITVNAKSRLNGMETQEFTFAEALKTDGYKTAIVGKWHLGYKKMYNPVHQGFDEFRGYVSGNIDFISHYDNSGVYDWWHNLELVEEDGYTTDLLTKHAVDYIRENQKETFCLYVAHEAPHWPFQGRSSRADRYEGSRPPGVPGHGHDPNPKARFKEMIEVMDEGVGEIVKTVRALGLQRDTFIFFCSDNGGDPTWCSNGTLRGHKGQLWEGGHRVPAIAWWPGKISPGRTDQLTMSMDIFPTLMALAGSGANLPNPLDGVDISAVLLRNEKLAERSVFWRYRKYKAVRRGQWKLLWHDGQVSLFDLETDLSESINLAEEQPNIVQQLKMALAQWEYEVPTKKQQKVL